MLVFEAVVSPGNQKSDDLLELLIENATAKNIALFADLATLVSANLALPVTSLKNSKNGIAFGLV